MKVLVKRREMGEDLWFAENDCNVLAETESHYKISQFLFWSKWLPKNGVFTKCEIVKAEEVRP